MEISLGEETMGSNTDIHDLYKPNSGEKSWATLVNANWTKLDYLMYMTDPGAKPPATPNIMDDEFMDGSTDAKWTQYETGSGATFTETNQGVFEIEVGDTLGAGFNVLYQAIPSGTFSAVTRLSSASMGEGTNVSRADNVVCGLVLMEGLTASDKKIVYGHIPQWDYDMHLYDKATDTGDFSAGTWDLNTYSIGLRPYMKIEVTPSSWKLYSSYDGLTWTSVFDSTVTDFTPLFTPSHIGIGIARNITTNGYTAATFSFFRVDWTPDFDITG